MAGQHPGGGGGRGHGRQDDGRNGKKNRSVCYEDTGWHSMKWKRPIGENTAETS